MDKNVNARIILYILLLLLGNACAGEYAKAEATIIDLKSNYPDPGIYTATLEYTIDGINYTGEFEISVETLVRDSISTPVPGTKFEILYNRNDPTNTKIDFQVKPTYINH